MAPRSRRRSNVANDGKKTSSLASDFEDSKPKMFKVTLDGLDLLNDTSGSLRMAFGRLIPGRPEERLGGGPPAIKIRFWVHSNQTDALMAELLQGKKPSIEIEADNINAVIG